MNKQAHEASVRMVLDKRAYSDIDYGLREMAMDGAVAGNIQLISGITGQILKDRDDPLNELNPDLSNYGTSGKSVMEQFKELRQEYNDMLSQFKSSIRNEKGVLRYTQPSPDKIENIRAKARKLQDKAQDLKDTKDAHKYFVGAVGEAAPSYLLSMLGGGAAGYAVADENNKALGAGIGVATAVLLNLIRRKIKYGSAVWA